MARPRDRFTADLLSWEPPSVAVGYEDGVAGRGSLGNQIARLVSRALRDARDDRDLSRADIAAALSAELRRSVSTDMLDKWSSEAATQHRIALDAFVALIKVTGAEDLLGFIPGLFGFAVVPAKYAALIELQLIEEHEQEIAARKARVAAQWRARR